jgi:hypothetical protein
MGASAETKGDYLAAAVMLSEQPRYCRHSNIHSPEEETVLGPHWASYIGIRAIFKEPLA